MSKSGQTLIVKYEQLKHDKSILAKNQEAYRYLLSNPSSSIDLIAYTSNDLGSSIGRVVINYTKQFGFINAYFPTEKYTFSDTQKAENINVAIPYLNSFGEKCCWKGGEHVTDKWMHDLEIHGYAKSFIVRASWKLFSDLNVNQ